MARLTRIGTKRTPGWLLPRAYGHRLKGQLVHRKKARAQAPAVGASGVRAAAAKAGIKLPPGFGL